MGKPAISYAPRDDAIPEAEIATLANVYRFVLDSARKNAAGMRNTNGERPSDIGRRCPLAHHQIPRV